jgi:hypothetical protein
MNKITLKIDSSSSYDKALEEFNNTYKKEVEKKINNDKINSYLCNLHKHVNSKLNTNFGNTNSLIQALIPFASSTFKEKLQNSATGRRKTISMNKEIFFSIKNLLSCPSPNKAQIARQVGVSVVQVRKVADGGYDKKFLSNSDDSIIVEKEIKEINLDSTEETFLTAPSTSTTQQTQVRQTDSVTRPPMRLPSKSPLDL